MGSRGDTYYRCRRRYLAEGLEGLEDQSRRPKSSPVKIPAQLELGICEMRRDHPRWGARRIRTELARAGTDPPAVSTIHQVLVRNGLVAAQPPRRPRADKRFEREIANDLWQIDATQIPLGDGSKGWVVDLIDDHSRYLLAAVAGPASTGELAWDAFELAASRYGLPRQVLSDNGLCFTGRLHGTEVMFEKSLDDLDVEMINSAPYHPQTLGKLERFHRTLKEWLTDEGPPFDLEHLQELLDGFRFHYNRQRPHQGIGDATPAECYGTADHMVRVDVDVADNGPPMPAEATERIFEPYQRAHGASDQPDSVGIGLSIARTLARLMGGDVIYIRRDDWNVFQLSLPPASLQTEPVTAGVGANPATV